MSDIAIEKKAKLGLGAIFLLGIIYTGLGGTFLVLGVCLSFGLRDTEAWMVGAIFAGIGSLFFLLGIVFLAVEFRKKRQADQLLYAGRYIWAEVADLVPNLNVRINGRNPYMLLVRYTDAAGTAHVFRSRSLRIYPDRTVIGRKVKVYIKDDTYHPYYVDTEGVLPHVVEHAY